MIDWRWFSRLDPRWFILAGFLAALLGCLLVWVVWRLRRRIRLSVRSTMVLVAAIAVMMVSAETVHQRYFPPPPEPLKYLNGNGFPMPERRRRIDARGNRRLCVEYRVHHLGPFWWASDIEYQVTPYPPRKPEQSKLAP
jgi:hypothetical protein